MIKKTDPETLQVGDVICYMEEEAAVTHRIMEVQTDDTGVMYVTQGDANNTEDLSPVRPTQVQGIYTGISFSRVGDFAIFLQSTPGMLIFIGGPIALFVLWDLLRRMVQSRKVKAEHEMLAAESADKQQEMEEMERELERLRAQVGNAPNEND